MADTYTTNVGIVLPAFNDSGWNALLNENFAQIDGLGAVGPLAVARRENPSSSLYVIVAAGSFWSSALSLVSYAGSTGTLLTASSTNYVYLTDSGTLTTNTSGFPGSTNIARLAVVVTGTTTITSISDARLPWRSAGGTAAWLPLIGGTLNDGSGVVTIGLGTTNGTQIGTSTSQKLGFYGATPIAQPTIGSATAGTSYTTTEQGMLQRVYNAVRNLGLGS